MKDNSMQPNLVKAETGRSKNLSQSLLMKKAISKHYKKAIHLENEITMKEYKKSNLTFHSSKKLVFFFQ